MKRARAASIACLSIALACASKPTHEPGPSVPLGEPLMFVEAPPDPAQSPSIPHGATPVDATQAAPSNEQDLERAKLLYSEGVGMFEVGDFAEALARFEQTYALAPMPALLFNIAQCRQQLGDKPGACADYAELIAAPDVHESAREASLQAIAQLGC